MNPRSIVRRYFGWCPGLKSASKFVPNREIPPNKIAAAFFLSIIVFFTCFFTTNHLLLIFGGLRRPFSVSNANPHLVVAGRQLYLFVEVHTTPVKYQEAIINGFRVKLRLDGTIWDKVEVPAVGDVLVTKDGVWYLAYESRGIKVIWSEDGVKWKGPVTIAEDKGKIDFREPPLSGNSHIRFLKPALTEMGDGRIFLSFTRSVLYNLSTIDGYDFVNRSLEAYYSILGHDGEWSPPTQIPVLIPDSHISLGNYGGTNIYWKSRDIAPLEPSCFTMRDGKVGIVAVDGNATTYELNGIWLTTMNESGAWSQPRHLFLFRGRNPQMFYSPSKNGYFLFYENHEKDLLEVTFTTNMKTWGRITCFPMWPTRASMAELPNGTVVMAYENFPYISITSTQNGVEWATPRNVELITSENALKTAKSQQNTYISALIGSVFGIIAMIIALNILGHPPPKWWRT